MAHLSAIPAGQLPFSCIKDALYASRTQTDFEGNKYYGTNFSNYLYYDMRDLKFSVHCQRPASMRRLVSALLVYRNERANNPADHYSFFGIRGGYSKQQKLDVVDKVLIHIYGTEAEKKQVGAMTRMDLKLFNNGNLARVLGFNAHGSPDLASFKRHCERSEAIQCSE